MKWFLILITIGIAGFALNTCEPLIQSDDDELKINGNLTVTNTFLSKATLQLSIKNGEYPAYATLYRGVDSLASYTLTASDTVFYDKGLKSQTDYHWHLDITFANSKRLNLSASSRTMDTTSHNFTFRVDTLGQRASLLRDVAIVNDTCIWVVGDIMTIPFDSQNRYNAARWNGKEWMKYRIKFKNFTGTESVQIIYSVLNTNDGNIVFISEIGSVVISDIYYQNIIKNTTVIAGRGTPSKSWGASSSDFYFVGTNGSITHYNGQSFSLLESGTSVDLTEISANSSGNMFTCGYSRKNGETILLQNKGLGFTNYGINLKTPLTWISAVHLLNPNQLFISANAQLYWIDLVDSNEITKLPIHNTDGHLGGIISRIRGSKENDIVIAGDNGSLWHFNGSTLHRFYQFADGYTYFRSVDYKNGLMVAVGQDYVPYDNALIVFGYKEN